MLSLGGHAAVPEGTGRLMRFPIVTVAPHPPSPPRKPSFYHFTAAPSLSSAGIYALHG